MVDHRAARVPAEVDDSSTPALDRTDTGPGARRRRALAALVDEAASSLQNYVVLFAALHYLSIADVGRFTLAYTTVILIEILIKSLTLTSLSVDFASAPPRRQRDGAAAAATATLLVGTAAFGFAVLVGVATGGTNQSVLFASGAAALALAAQEVWRVFFFTIARPWRAVLNDAACLLFTICLAAAAIRAGRADTPADLVWLLAAGTGFGFLVGVVQTGILPAPRAGVRWLRETWAVGVRVAGSRGVAQLAGRLSLAVISLISGAIALGRIAASRTLIAPATTVVTAMAAYSLPEAARLRDRADPRFRRFLIVNSVGLATIVIVAGGIVALLPASAGRALAGHNFAVAKQLLLPVMLVAAANALQQGARIGMIALKRAGLTLRIATTTGLGVLAAAAIGAWLGGAPGAAWGIAAVQLAQVLTWWAAFIRVSAAAPTGHPT